MISLVLLPHPTATVRPTIRTCLPPPINQVKEVHPHPPNRPNKLNPITMLTTPLSQHRKPMVLRLTPPRPPRPRPLSRPHNLPPMIWPQPCTTSTSTGPTPATLRRTASESTPRRSYRPPPIRETEEDEGVKVAGPTTTTSSKPRNRRNRPPRTTSTTRPCTTCRVGTPNRVILHPVVTAVIREDNVHPRDHPVPMALVDPNTTSSVGVIMTGTLP
jgi:hypothetical protein